MRHHALPRSPKTIRRLSIVGNVLLSLVAGVAFCVSAGMITGGNHATSVAGVVVAFAGILCSLAVVSSINKLF